MERAQTEPIMPSEPRRDIRLPPIQTTFPTKPHQRSQRPRLRQTVTRNQTSQSAPIIEDAAMGRKTSKGLILGLFGRNKTYRSTRPEPTLTTQDGGRGEENIAEAMAEDEKRASVAGRTPFAQDISIGPRVPRAATSPIKKLPAKGGRGRSLRKDTSTWDPPPLFQAYPQAIKHATLPAPMLSADAILRLSRSRENNASDLPPNAPDSGLWDADPEAHKRKPWRPKKGKGVGHDPVLDGEWTRKIYVLVTSGYFLQYSGEGNFDRLPEKILPLGKVSAAFASDAIPGQQWVLHIAQAASESDEPFSTQGPSSMFEKIRYFHEARRTASNLLLVIDCPDEMNAWLVAARKEIESLGGKKYLPDFAANKDLSEAAQKLLQKPSQRYLVKRDRQVFEQVRKPLPHGESMAVVPKPIGKDLYPTEPAVNRQSVDIPSSVSNITVSRNQNVLDKLRETPRMSYVSTGTKTVSTSQGSSPGDSPVRATFCMVDSKNPHNGSLAEATVTPKAHQMPTHAFPPPPTARRKSQNHDASQQQGSPPRNASSDGQSSSHPPNFSVPSFSKRYSTVNGDLIKAMTPPSARASTVLQPVVVEEESPSKHSASNGSPVSPRTSPKTSKSLGNLCAHYSHPPPSTPNFTTKSSPGELMISPKLDTKIPRRFSSLDYSRGVSPVPTLKQFPKSPHPPPTAALPEIPGMSPMVISPGSLRHSMQPMISPLQEERNACRPISMQVRSPPIVRINQSSFRTVSKHPQRIDESTLSSAFSMIPEFPDRRHSVASIPPPARSAPLPPVEPEVQSRSDPSSSIQTTVQAQNSLPLAHRPPPPNMPPLPRLPSIRVSRRGFRGSFEGPWTSGYITERQGIQGVRAN